MKKILLSFLLAALPIVGLAQSYPSPTYNNLTVLGAFTATGAVTLADLATQSANTVVANVTAATASPTAVALPSCSTANSALKYTSASGFSCGTTYALTSGTLAQFASTTSAQLAGVLSDETGTGSAVFATGGTINPTSIGATTPGTGAFTTLSATSTVSGAGFTSYLASPSAIGGTAANTGSFTTLASTGGALNGTLGATTPSTVSATTIVASSTITPSQTAGIVGTTAANNANAGSVGEYVTATGTGVALTTSNTPVNATSFSLTAGDWDVTGNASFTSGTGATTTVVSTSISTVSATNPSGQATSIVITSIPAGTSSSYAPPLTRVSIAATTTVYFVANAIFTGGTDTVSAIIRARRVR